MATKENADPAADGGATQIITTSISPGKAQEGLTPSKSPLVEKNVQDPKSPPTSPPTVSVPSIPPPVFEEETSTELTEQSVAVPSVPPPRVFEEETSAELQQSVAVPLPNQPVIDEAAGPERDENNDQNIELDEHTRQAQPAPTEEQKEEEEKPADPRYIIRETYIHRGYVHLEPRQPTDSSRTEPTPKQPSEDPEKHIQHPQSTQADVPYQVRAQYVEKGYVPIKPRQPNDDQEHSSRIGSALNQSPENSKDEELDDTKKVEEGRDLAVSKSSFKPLAGEQENISQYEQLLKARIEKNTVFGNKEEQKDKKEENQVFVKQEKQDECQSASTSLPTQIVNRQSESGGIEPEPNQSSESPKDKAPEDKEEERKIIQINEEQVLDKNPSVFKPLAGEQETIRHYEQLLEARLEEKAVRENEKEQKDKNEKIQVVVIQEEQDLDEGQSASTSLLTQIVDRQSESGGIEPETNQSSGSPKDKAPKDKEEERKVIQVDEEQVLDKKQYVFKPLPGQHENICYYEQLLEARIAEKTVRENEKEQKDKEEKNQVVVIQDLDESQSASTSLLTQIVARQSGSGGIEPEPNQSSGSPKDKAPKDKEEERKDIQVDEEQVLDKNQSVFKPLAGKQENIRYYEEVLEAKKEEKAVRENEKEQKDKNEKNQVVVIQEEQDLDEGQSASTSLPTQIVDRQSESGGIEPEPNQSSGNPKDEAPENKKEEKKVIQVDKEKGLGEYKCIFKPLAGEQENISQYEQLLQVKIEEKAVRENEKEQKDKKEKNQVVVIQEKQDLDEGQSASTSLPTQIVDRQSESGEIEPEPNQSLESPKDEAPEDKEEERKVIQIDEAKIEEKAVRENEKEQKDKNEKNQVVVIQEEQDLGEVRSAPPQSPKPIVDVQVESGGIEPEPNQSSGNPKDEAPEDKEEEKKVIQVDGEKSSDKYESVFKSLAGKQEIIGHYEQLLQAKIEEKAVRENETEQKDKKENNQVVLIQEEQDLDEDQSAPPQSPIVDLQVESGGIEPEPNQSSGKPKDEEPKDKHEEKKVIQVDEEKDSDEEISVFELLAGKPENIRLYEQLRAVGIEERTVRKNEKEKKGKKEEKCVVGNEEEPDLDEGETPPPPPPPSPGQIIDVAKQEPETKRTVVESEEEQEAKEQEMKINRREPFSSHYKRKLYSVMKEQIETEPNIEPSVDARYLLRTQYIIRGYRPLDCAQPTDVPSQRHEEQDDNMDARKNVEEHHSHGDKSPPSSSSTKSNDQNQSREAEDKSQPSSSSTSSSSTKSDDQNQSREVEASDVESEENHRETVDSSSGDSSSIKTPHHSSPPSPPLEFRDNPKSFVPQSTPLVPQAKIPEPPLSSVSCSTESVPVDSSSSEESDDDHAPWSMVSFREQLSRRMHNDKRFPNYTRGFYMCHDNFEARPPIVAEDPQDRDDGDDAPRRGGRDDDSPNRGNGDKPSDDKSPNRDGEGPSGDKSPPGRDNKQPGDDKSPPRRQKTSSPYFRLASYRAQSSMNPIRGRVAGLNASIRSRIFKGYIPYVQKHQMACIPKKKPLQSDSCQPLP